MMFHNSVHQNGRVKAGVSVTAGVNGWARQEDSPLPPPAPPTHISRGVADTLGKREWQIAKLKEGEDTFFKADTNTFEDRGVLGVRKEIWEWMVMCVEGEHKNLFCAHLVRECDKWDIQSKICPHQTLYSAPLQTPNFLFFTQVPHSPL